MMANQNQNRPRLANGSQRTVYVERIPEEDQRAGGSSASSGTVASSSRAENHEKGSNRNAASVTTPSENSQRTNQSNESTRDSPARPRGRRGTRAGWRVREYRRMIATLHEFAYLRAEQRIITDRGGRPNRPPTDAQRLCAMVEVLQDLADSRARARQANWR